LSIRDQERALVDAKGWRHADPDQAGFIPERRHMASLKTLQRRPRLPARRHELPFLVADRARVRRLGRGRILGAASGADERVHDIASFFAIALGAVMVSDEA
jgi:hypothetical protein